MHRNWIIRVLMPMEAIVVSGMMLALASTATGSDRTALIVGWLVAGLLLPAAVAFGMRLSVVVTDRRLTARFIPFFFANKTIDLDQIDSAEAIKYSPLADAGGWGIKSSRKFGAVLNVAGEYGVHIRYRHKGEPRQMLIGSEHPGELAAAIAKAKANPPTGTPAVREIPATLGPAST